MFTHCQGTMGNKIGTERGTIIDITGILINDHDHDTWYVSREYIQLLNTHKRVLRSTNCTHILTTDSEYYTGLCSTCAVIYKEGSFRSYMKRHKRQQLTPELGKHQNLTLKSKAELADIVRQTRKNARLAQYTVIKYSQRDIFRIATQRDRVETCKEIIRRGQINGNGFNGVVAALAELRAEGAFTKKQAPIVIVEDILKRIGHSGHGLRTSPETDALQMYLRQGVGKKIYAVMSANLGLQHERTARKHLRTGASFKYGVHEDNFVLAAHIYKETKKQLGIDGLILTQMSEDETQIINQPSWFVEGDCIIGFCGRHCTNKCAKVAGCRKRGECESVHQCDHTGTNHVKIGTGESGYDIMESQYQSMRVATNLRVVIINPLHPQLPRLPILLMGTCNAFAAADFVRPQWILLEALYDKHLAPVLGPMIGHASDGDPRRRKLQRADMLRKGDNMFTLEPPSFTHSMRVFTDTNGQEQFRDLHDQDYIHCGKKLINALHQSSRVLTVGPQKTAHMNHLTAVMDDTTNLSHGLRSGDDRRSGYTAMDWPSAERLMSPRVLECLEGMWKGVGGRRPTYPEAQGTWRFLFVVRKFVNIFQSRVLSYKQRIENAAYVVTYLRLWRQWAKQATHVCAKSAFISDEAFVDTLLQCHSAVLLIVAGSKNTPDTPIHFDRTGTDCNEDFFSQLGSWVMNKRTYTVLAALDTTRALYKMIALASEGRVELPKHNVKLFTHWTDDTLLEGSSVPDYTNYPTDDDIKKSWNAGVILARRNARTDGMEPRRRNARWWKFPEEDDLTVAASEAMGYEDVLNEGKQPEANDINEEDNNENNDDDDDDDDHDSGNDNVSGALDPAVAAADFCREVVLADEQRHHTTVAQVVYHPTLQRNLHKRSLLAFYYSGRTLSSDRVVRARSDRDAPEAQAEDMRIELRTQSWLVHLGGDIAVVFVEPNGSKVAYYGRVTRMICRSRDGKNPRDYRLPVKMLDDKSKMPNVRIQCHWYKSGQYSPRILTLTEADINPVHIEEVICPVTITYREAHDNYEVDEHHHEVVRRFIVGGEQVLQEDNW